MSTCLICGSIEPAGTFVSQDWRAHERPFRVLFDGDGDGDRDGGGSASDAPAFIDVATLEMAQAAACGLPQARILTLKMESRIRESTRPPHEASLQDANELASLPGTACRALMSRPIGTKSHPPA